MMRSNYGRVSSRAPHAWASTAVWIALMQMASPAQASPGDTDLVSVSPTTGMSGSGNSDFGTKGAAQPVSADGRFVAFTSGAPDLVAGPSNDRWQVYLRDRGAGTTERISVTPAGLYGNNDSTNASISADGRYVAFVSLASDLVPGDTNGVFDVFVRDRQTGSTERVSVSSNGTQVGGWSDEPSISANGRYVAFRGSGARLVAGDTNGRNDVFVHDRDTGITTIVSVATGLQAVHSGSPVISADGRSVVFITGGRIFVRDRQAGTTKPVDVSTSGGAPNASSDHPKISADGRYVAFTSWASNLVLGDGASSNDVFVRDQVARTTERVNMHAGGLYDWYDIPGVWARISISVDGRYVAFVSSAESGVTSVFIRDRQLQSTTLASVNSSGVLSNSASTDPGLSADGRFVVFDSFATNLVANDANEFSDVFIHELGGSTSSTYEFSVKPTALAFGNQALSTATTLSVWVTNKGITALPITSVELVGLNPGMFSAVNRCGSSVAIGASCSVRVTFRPTSVGEKSAKLRIVAGDNDVRTKALSGTGVVSAFGVSPTALDFGSVPVNTTTAVKVVRISNTGSATLPISSITLGGWNPYQFATTHNCSANLAVGANCTVNVVFKPTTPVGSKAALLSITPGGGAATRSVALAGAAH